ncbi:hypothetical protein [Virgibacillus sp. 6R]|uniref:hypothetical protein n=1 Tax=Metabacillus sp. 22489 TaxID=3453928 RepID=UPI0016429237
MLQLKNLLYALITLFMLYIGLQQITLTGDRMQTVFIMSWLCLAIFVISGNFAHYLYGSKKKVQGRNVQRYKNKKQKQSKVYLRQ